MNDRRYLAVLAALALVACRSHAPLEEHEAPRMGAVVTPGQTPNASPVIVYQQGGTANPSRNVYATWASAYAAAQLVASSAPTIVVDATYGTPTIPAGTWVVDRWTFQGAGYGSPAYGALQIAQGAVLTVPSGFVVNNLTITSNATSTSPITNQSPYIYLTNGASLTMGAGATVPFISCASGTGAVLVLSNTSFTTGVAGAAVLSAASGSFAAGIASAGSAFNSFSFAGSGTVTVYLYDQGAALAAQTGATLTVYPALGISNSPFFSLAVTLASGTATVASGKNLTRATLLGCTLTTPNTAVGTPVATFVAGANGNVTVTSKTAAGATATTDASTYTCLFAGAY